MEIFILGAVVGGLLVGSRGGKGLVKAAAKGYLSLSERAREISANMREDMRDAIEEARYEYQQDQVATDRAEADAAAAAAPHVVVAGEYAPVETAASPAPKRRTRRTTTRAAAAPAETAKTTTRRAPREPAKPTARRAPRRRAAAAETTAEGAGSPPAAVTEPAE